MMTSAIQTEIENVISAIDGAMLNIHRAREVKYQYFDFTSTFQNLLSNPHHRNWSYKVERYLSVFTDLFKPVKTYQAFLKEVDRDNHRLIYETYTTSESGTIQNDDNIVSYEPAQFASMAANAQVGKEAVSVPVSKFSSYIGDALSDVESIRMSAFEKQYEDLFSKYGYHKSGIDFHRIVPTFEQYIDWINQERGI